MIKNWLVVLLLAVGCATAESTQPEAVMVPTAQLKSLYVELARLRAKVAHLEKELDTASLVCRVSDKPMPWEY